MNIKLSMAPLLLFFVSLQVGCSTVTVTQLDGELVKVERSFGGVRIEIPMESQTVVAKIKGLGYVSSPTGLSVGLLQHMVAAGGRDCSLTVFLEGESGFNDGLIRKLREIEQICVINENGETR